MDAASQGHMEIVKLLLSHGAEVNAQSACGMLMFFQTKKTNAFKVLNVCMILKILTGNSPLMYSAAAGHEDIVKELLKAGARVEDNNENGHTPLMVTFRGLSLVTLFFFENVSSLILVSFFQRNLPLAVMWVSPKYVFDLYFLLKEFVLI